MEHELIFVWAVIVTITLVIMIVFVMKLRKKHDSDIQEMNKKLEQKQTKSFQAGVNMTSGDYTQILGDFALLPKYDQIITLSTTSQQPSLDLIGISEESLDFLEIKKKGAKISDGENHVRRLVEEKKVSYKVFDIELPDGFTLEERKLKKLKDKVEKFEEDKEKKENLQKIESQKEHPNAYEPWTESDDEFLKKFWNDNPQNSDEKIQELMNKLGRTHGSIKSRLNLLGLE